MKNNPSKKHHYLPRHYLNGFTNNEGIFYVYDKRSDKIHSTSPKDAFFEKNLNTVKYPDGSTSDFLEGLYSKLESQCWPSLDTIRQSTHTAQINPLDMMNLYLFLLNLHWRLPSNLEYVEPLSQKFFQERNEFDYFQIKSIHGDIVPIEIIESVRSSSAFMNSAKLLVPLAPFFKDQNWSLDLERWRFLYSGDNKVWFMVGDNPIITRGDSDHDPINCLKEFIFPISGKILLINSNIHEGKMLPPEFTVKYNLAIIERARRFVACERKDFLEALIGLHQQNLQHKINGNIIPDLFDALLI